MTPPEVRLERMEAELDRLRPSLLDRLERVEEAVKRDAEPAPASGWKGFVMQTAAELPKFVTAIVLLVVGWGIKDSVDLSLRQRQLDLSYAVQMQGLLQKMSDPPHEKTQIESSAIMLATYGEAALPPLMSELHDTGLRGAAAAKGIAMLAETHPTAVCEVLPRVLENRVRPYDWMAQESAIRILGDARCTGAVAGLKQYRAAVVAAQGGDAAALDGIMREPPAAREETYSALVAAVDRSLQLIQR
jgi:hypothetical protein